VDPRRRRWIVPIALVCLALSSAPAALATPRGLPPLEPPAALAPVSPEVPTQVVVFDRVLRTTTVVSHDQLQAPGDASSSRPSITAAGNQVAFESDAVLVPEDTNRRADIYLWDGAPDQVQRISAGRSGEPANGNSRDPSISGDGGVIAFSSTAQNMTADTGLDGQTGQVFAWQRTAAAIGLVSVATDGGGGSAASGRPSVSADGRVVGFQSAAADLVPGDGNALGDVLLRDLNRGATIRASVAEGGGDVTAESGRPAISGDGGAVVFDSTASGLVSRDSNNVRDVFVRDLPPAVLVTPNPLDFGVVPLGMPSTRAVTVLSVGWTPVAMSPSSISGTDAGDFLVADDACAGQVVAYGASCSIVILDVPVAAGPRSATLSITDSALDSPQVVELVGGVPGAELRLDPEVGPPGIVTLLRGENFPPGALVSFQWDRGITQPLAPVLVAPDGTFAVSVLVFHNDRTGPRQLRVTAAPGGATFADEMVSFLVVPGPLQPPGSSALTFLDPSLRVTVTRR
jgi:Tol biopolymer transport system component